MPSSISFGTTPSQQSKHSIYRKPAKKPMSLTSVYFLAHSARGKLSKEASRADHDLRLLVGHANMLDSLMIDLATAEQEQERWFNKSVAATEEEPEEEWAETVTEEEESEDEEMEQAKDEDTVITETEIDSDDEENYGELALTRTSSRHSHSPPELSSDSDSDSEDEQMPSSPPQPTISVFTEKQRQQIATTSFYDAKELSPTEQESFEQQGFFLPSRQQPIQIAAY